MNHNEQCRCIECQMTQTTATTTTTVDLRQMDTIAIAWSGKRLTDRSLRVRQDLPLPPGPRWPHMRIVGSALLAVPDGGEIVALIAVDDDKPPGWPQTAIWWDRAERRLVAALVAQ